MRRTLPIAVCAHLLGGCAGEPEPLPKVWISEIVAANEHSLEQDEDGDSLADADGVMADWVELYNPGKQRVDLSGWHLTDDLDEAGKWAFPAGTAIEGGGYLLVYCSGDETRGPLHTSFRLSITGEAVGLFGPYELNSPRVDAVEFGPIAKDYSWSRLEEGAEPVIAWPPTPGEANRLDPQPAGGAP